MAKAKTPKTYVDHTGPNYQGGVLYEIGKPFTTDADKEDRWEEVDKLEKVAIDAADKSNHPSANLEALPAAALDAVAVTKNVDTTDLSKKDKITAIKAASDPSL